MRAVVVGPSQGLVTAFERRGVGVGRVEGVAVREELEAAGVADADVVVFTDVGEASAVPVARRVNPDARVVFYTADSVPEFATPSVALSIDPNLLDPATVVDELVRGGESVDAGADADTAVDGDVDEHGDGDVDEHGDGDVDEHGDGDGGRDGDGRT